MYLSIIILPLLGSIVSGFFGRKVGVTGSRILGCLSIMITTILAIISFFEVGFNNNPVSINLFKWLDNESFNMAWNFQFDSLTVSMLIPVLIISSLVHFYSIGYMSSDPRSKMDPLSSNPIDLHKRKQVYSSILQKRYYSNGPGLEDKRFLEWFCGLTDGEGSFMFLRTRDGYGFKFSIGLHIDDIKILHLIQSTLKLGKVYINGSAARFVVTNVKDTAKIIDIFSRYTLNTTKLLNFRDFKKAFEVYTSSRLKTTDILDEVEEIRSGMNSLRSDFTLPPFYSVRITPDWLLGFIEGEGSFSVRKNYSLTFSLAQSIKDLVLMEAIRDFLNSLASRDGQLKGEAVKLYIKNHDMVYLTIDRLDYISRVLIPLLDTLSWKSKKELDYKDWKTILKLRTLGLHYTEEGVKIINIILSQMNNNRLTTRRSGLVDRAALDCDIKRLLKGPSNFEIKEDGRIFIKSLNKYYNNKAKIRLDLINMTGDIIESFDSSSDCAKYLNVSPMTVSLRLRSSKPFLFKGKLVYIKKSAVAETSSLYI
jgi:hypothetical protein